MTATAEKKTEKPKNVTNTPPLDPTQAKILKMEHRAGGRLTSLKNYARALISRGGELGEIATGWFSNKKKLAQKKKTFKPRVSKKVKALPGQPAPAKKKK